MKNPKQLSSTIEKTNSGFSAYIDELDGVVATGLTIDEVKRNIITALQMHIEGLKEDGELPDFLENIDNVTLTFRTDIETFFAWYSGILTKSGVSRLTGVNQSLINQYALGIKTPGEKQLKKIERSLHDFGRDMMAINF